MRIVVLGAAFTTGVVAGAFVMETFGIQSAALEPRSHLVLQPTSHQEVIENNACPDAWRDRDNGRRARLLCAARSSHLGESLVERDCIKRARIWGLTGYAGPNDHGQLPDQQLLSRRVGGNPPSRLAKICASLEYCRLSAAGDGFDRLWIYIGWRSLICASSSLGQTVSWAEKWSAT